VIIFTYHAFRGHIPDISPREMTGTREKKLTIKEVQPPGGGNPAQGGGVRVGLATRGPGEQRV